jgi:hypothetical protein
MFRHERRHTISGSGQGRTMRQAIAHGTKPDDVLTSRLVTTGGIMPRRPRACWHLMEGETTADHPISVSKPEEAR